MARTNTFRDLRSILEVPALNDKFVAKARETQADAVMLDLEDSVPPERKDEARAKVAAVLTEPGVFGARIVFVRVNNLTSPWGMADLVALGASRAPATACYPKVETRDEMEHVLAILRRENASASVYAMIETARAVAGIESIAPCEGLCGLHFGYVDLATEMECSLFAETGDRLHPAMDYARARIATAARAQGLFSTGGSMIPALKDMEKVERFVWDWKAFGYSACMALSPSHVGVINRVFRPSDEALEAARRICVAFEAAIARGALNVEINGRIVTGPDYRQARRLLGAVSPVKTLPV
ncbi:CoA ester lyase [Rhodophyticola sp. DY48A3-103]|nr:CoA ester lyase [Alterinioella nitratireducens]